MYVSYKINYIQQLIHIVLFCEMHSCECVKSPSNAQNVEKILF